MNGVNLKQFPFEYDLTWMSFFQNADGETYARYGGREDHNAESHLNKASLMRVMQQALDLHKDNDVQPNDRYNPVATSSSTPEDIPPMKEMIGKRNESCIHCHDVKFAQLRDLDTRRGLTKEMVFTYPSPGNFGLHIDPQRQNMIARVDDRSAAADAGLRTGDRLLTIDDHRVLTYADVTRVLEFWQDGQQLPLAVERRNRQIETQVELPDGWRRNVDVSWRPSLGAVGPNAGFWGNPLNARQKDGLGLGLQDEDMAMRITVVWGQWAKQAGVRNGDIVLSVNGQTNLMSPRQVHAHLQLNCEWGDEVTVVVRRGNRNVDLTLKLPTEPPE